MDISYFVTLGVILLAYMSLWFVVSVIKKRNDVADVAWGLGFVLMAWTALYLSGDVSARGVLVNLVVSIWGVRLAWHIYTRTKAKAEDYRYLAWRNEWGAWFYPRSYVQVYLLQGALLFLISLPILVIHARAGSALSYLDLIGVSVWLVGFFFEVVGDAQLARFIQNPANKGKLLQSGLWAYTRHPNYFGEITQWWGVWLIALSVSGGLYTIVGPLMITFLITKVSGIPLLEKKMAEHPEFAGYARRVSVLIPMPPRSTR